MEPSFSIVQNVNILRDSMRRMTRENNRQSENLRLYDGTDFGQWVGADTNQLIADGKWPHTYNLIKKAIDTIVGSCIADTMDTHFAPEYGEKNNLSIMLNELHIEDSELGHYTDELMQVMRMGFIYRGWAEIFKDRSRDPRGRVGIQFRSSDQIVVDPDWVTKRVNDNKRLFILSWMTAEQIKERYDAKAQEIENAISLYKNSSGSYGGIGAIELDKVFDRSPEFYDSLNGLYLVYDLLTLEKRKTTRLFDHDYQEFVKDISQEDMDMWANAARSLGRNVEIVEEEGTICKVETGAPAISLSLKIQEGDHPIQIGGYPFIPFSCDALNGRPNTPVDQLKDVQQTINKRETTVTHMLMTGANDTLFIETSAMENPDTDLDKIGKGVRRPGGYYNVADGALSQQRIGYLRSGQTRYSEFIDASNHVRDYADRITPAVPSLQAVGQGQESGVLYQAKVSQAQVSMVIPKRNLMAFWEELGNAWFMAARRVYTYPMILSSPKGEFRFNMPGGVMMADIPRVRVTITQSPKSETLRRQQLQQYIATSQYAADPLSKAVMWKNTAAGLPDVPDDKLKEIEDAANISVTLAKLQAAVQIGQLQQQLTMLQQPQMAPQAPPGMGGPVGPPPGPPQQQGKPMSPNQLLGPGTGAPQPLTKAA